MEDTPEDSFNYDPDIQALVEDGVGHIFTLYDEEEKPVVKYRAISETERTYATSGMLNEIENKTVVGQLMRKGSFKELDVLDAGLTPQEGYAVVRKYIAYCIYYGIKDFYKTFQQLSPSKCVGIIETWKKDKINKIAAVIFEKSGLKGDVEDRVMKFHDDPKRTATETPVDNSSLPTRSRLTETHESSTPVS